MTTVCRERRSWTPREDQLLRNAVEKEDPGNPTPSKWHAIAKHVPNRTNKDCRKRWFAKMASDVVKGGWAPDEDERLVRGIERYGTRWSLVASVVQTRNSDQCAKRWTDTLNPAIDRTSWTPEADELLIQAVNQHGKVWTKIVKTYFPGRTGLSAKNRYNSITRFGAENSRQRNRRKTPESAPYPVHDSSRSDASSSSPRTSSPSSSVRTPETTVPLMPAPMMDSESYILEQLSGWSPTTPSDVESDYSAYRRLSRDGDFKTAMSSPSTPSSDSSFLSYDNLNTFVSPFPTAIPQQQHQQAYTVPRDILPTTQFADQRRINTPSSFATMPSHNIRPSYPEVFDCRDMASNFAFLDPLPAQSSPQLDLSWQALQSQDDRAWQRLKIPVDGQYIF
ncbi:hypothetical protein AX16_004619 [Volvariella volvacea WC 439]|nr:hypothetical protein AX16_004619 [Volvariella volvacea WC 439]